MLFLLRFLSVRYWLRHRGAFFLAGLGVALGIAVFVAVQVANSSVLGAFGASLDALTGKANLQIRGGASGLPDTLFTRIENRNDPRIRAAAPVLLKTLVAPRLKTSILVSGVDLFSEADFRSYDLENTVEGHQTRGQSREPLQFLLDPNAIAISRALADKHSLKIGAPLELFIGAHKKTFKIAAILDAETAGRAFGGDFALLDIAAAQEAFGEEGRLSQIDLMVEDDALDSVQRDLRKLAPPDAIVARPAQRGEQVATMLAAFQLNLTALSSIACFVGAFLIYNALASAVVRRRGEAGILRAMGASKGQITRLFLVEAALIGFFGSLAGLGLGLILAHWTLSAVATTVSQLYLSVKAREIFVPDWLWWGAPLAGTILSVLAALPAAHEAAGTAPRAAMTGLTLHHALEKWAPLLAVTGLLLGAFAAILCLPVFSNRSPFFGFAAAGATLAGFALLTPLATLWGGRALRPFAEKIGGIEGALAADNLRRALNRSSLAIAALLVSLALTVGMNVMVRSFRATVAEWVDGTISADLFVAGAAGFDGERSPGLPPDVVAAATHLPGVRLFDTLRQTEVEIAGKPIEILANTLPALKTGERVIRFASTQRGKSAAESDFQAGRAILVGERLASVLKLRAGDLLAIPTPRGPRKFPIAGVFYDYNPNSVLYMQRAVYQKIWNDPHLDALALYLDKTTSGVAAKRALEAKFGAKYALTLLPNSQIRAEVFRTFDQTFAVTYALQLIAVIVAAVGVFDTLFALVLERGRELAALRAMGATRGQIRKMTLLEFGFLALFAWVLGVAAGLVLAWQLIFVINRQFFGWTIFWTLPPFVFVQAAFLALAAALGAGLLPSRTAARKDLATALQME